MLARRTGPISLNRWSRTPSTRSAPAAAGASSLGISSGRCWPSASRVTTPSKPRPKRSAKAKASAAPLPRLRGKEWTRAPAAPGLLGGAVGRAVVHHQHLRQLGEGAPRDRPHRGGRLVGGDGSRRSAASRLSQDSWILAQPGKIAFSSPETQGQPSPAPPTPPRRRPPGWWRGPRPGPAAGSRRGGMIPSSGSGSAKPGVGPSGWPAAASTAAARWPPPYSPSDRLGRGDRRQGRARPGGAQHLRPPAGRRRASRRRRRPRGRRPPGSTPARSRVRRKRPGERRGARAPSRTAAPWDRRRSPRRASGPGRARRGAARSPALSSTRSSPPRRPGSRCGGGRRGAPAPRRPLPPGPGRRSGRAGRGGAASSRPRAPARTRPARPAATSAAPRAEGDAAARPRAGRP